MLTNELKDRFSRSSHPGSPDWFLDALAKAFDPSRDEQAWRRWVDSSANVEEIESSLVDIERYRWDPFAYSKEILGWEPWSGGSRETPGQVEILEAYVLALRQMHERRAWLRGEITKEELDYWDPSKPIKSKLAIDAGHNVGKTKMGSLLINHFLDSFTPSIVYTYAPSYEQIHDLLWKEIKVDRRGKGLPGQINDLEIKIADNHFAKGRATNNAGDKGLERVHGQHNEYLMFVIDEAEGVQKFVWDAIEAMSSGGIVLLITLRNPRTRTSEAHRFRSRRGVDAFRISCIWHPNVAQNKEIIPNCVTRDWVEDMVDRYCEPTPEHNPEEETFELPWRPEAIYKPNSPIWHWKVEGRPSTLTADDTFVSFVNYEAAKTRVFDPSHESRDPPHVLWLGIDVARRGSDAGTIYERRMERIRRLFQIYGEDGYAYFIKIKERLKKAKDQGVSDVRIRVDGTGVGSSVVDQLIHDIEIESWFEYYSVTEVIFNSVPYDEQRFRDLITEMYYHTGEALKVMSLENPPGELEDDLCSRKFKYGKYRGYDVRYLEDKDSFKDRYGRSPDDGDGCVLVASPDYIFDTERGDWPSNYPDMIAPQGYKHLYERHGS